MWNICVKKFNILFYYVVVVFIGVIGEFLDMEKIVKGIGLLSFLLNKEKVEEF